MTEYVEIIIEIFKQEPLVLWGTITLLTVYCIIKVWRISGHRVKKSNKSSKQCGNIQVVKTNKETSPIPIEANKQTKRIETENREVGKVNNVSSKNEKDVSILVNAKINVAHKLDIENEHSEDLSVGKDQLLKVNYLSNYNDSTEQYPILRIPKQGCIIRSYREERSKLRGYKEPFFENALKGYLSGNYDLRGNIRLNINKNTRPFEPDIAIVAKGSKYNINIDIEIDEPYAGISRQATHVIGDDYARDCYFVDRGWMVIRFSEYQVHNYEKECIKFILDIIHSIDKDFKLSGNISKNNLLFEDCWNLLQAQRWEKEKYREKYLGHNFKDISQPEISLDYGLNENEIVEEKRVINTSYGRQVKYDNVKGDNPGRFTHKDNRIVFYPEKHIYTVDGLPMESVTAVISRFFPTFDPDLAILKMKQGEKWNPSHEHWGKTDNEIKVEWKTNGEKDAKDGVYLHEQIENYFKNKSYSEPEEFKHFRTFLENNQSLYYYKSEWRIFDVRYKIAGTIDLLAKRNDVFDMYDWKRSKKVISNSGDPIIANYYEKGIGVLGEMDNTAFNRYELQQNLYKYILETNYGIKIGKMYIVVMHPLYTKPYQIEIQEMNDEINKILQVIK